MRDSKATAAAWTPAFFSHFDDIRVINLPRRTDRRAQVTAELARMGLSGSPKVAFFDAIEPVEAGTFTSKGARGVYLSQLAILETAADCGRSVLILEDDVDFRRTVWDFTMPSAWDIVYGGYYAADFSDLPNSDIIGAHCMGFSARAVWRLAPYLRELLTLTDHPPIDGAYVWFRRAGTELITVFAEPALAEQRSSRTDIAAQRWFDRTPGLREAVGLARRARRAIHRNFRD